MSRKEVESRKIKALVENAERKNRGILTINNESLTFFFNFMVRTYGRLLTLPASFSDNAFFVEMNRDVVEYEIDENGYKRLEQIQLDRFIDVLTSIELDELKHILHNSLRTALGLSCKR